MSISLDFNEISRCEKFRVLPKRSLSNHTVILLADGHLKKIINGKIIL